MSTSTRIDVERILLAHEYTIDKGAKCGYPNGRNFHGIIYCIEGAASFKFFSKNIVTIKQGEILLLSDKAAYTLYANENFKHYTINFKIHPETSKMDFLKNHYYTFSAENYAAYYQLLKNAVHCKNSGGCAFEMRTTAYIYEFLALLISEMAKKDGGSEFYLRLKPAREYIEKHFTQEITIDLLANLCNMSKTNFRRE